MPRFRFRLRTWLIVVALVGLALGTADRQVTPDGAWLRWGRLVVGYSRIGGPFGYRMLMVAWSYGPI